MPLIKEVFKEVNWLVFLDFIKFIFMTKRFQSSLPASFLLILSLVVFSCSEKKTPADLIIRGGIIYTAEDSNPVVEAVAVIGDKIVYAGDLKNSSKFEGENTRVIDLQLLIEIDST